MPSCRDEGQMDSLLVNIGWECTFKAYGLITKTAQMSQRVTLGLNLPAALRLAWKRTRIIWKPLGSDIGGLASGSQDHSNARAKFRTYTNWDIIASNKWPSKVLKLSEQTQDTEKEFVTECTSPFLAVCSRSRSGGRQCDVFEEMGVEANSVVCSRRQKWRQTAAQGDESGVRRSDKGSRNEGGETSDGKRREWGQTIQQGAQVQLADDIGFHTNGPSGAMELIVEAASM
ncbi:hypothetical protein EV702DRAFT_1231097 [Suillus placidus]|uniref:Uncharacterized protein n=1 Tax=Suillus placidus TaxID=48579 RepID=A0A9P7D1W5_9AGAM|nr:hypothetical protein EV702DRAFT_1231097 [Suillus placidus]